MRMPENDLEIIRKIGRRLTEHDILNEITNIKGFSALMKETSIFEWKKDWVEQISSSARKIEKILKMTGSYFELMKKKESVPVVDAFFEAAEFFPELLDTINFTAGCPLKVWAHRSVMVQIFYNLLYNSQRYAGKKLSVISLECAHSEIIYKDNGVGIPKEAKEKIFDEGYTKGDGAGLGLFLIKRFCNLYGWEITEMGIEGKGVEFVIAITN